MEQMIGKHGGNWIGPTKARKDINLYIGYMYYINGLCASLWLIEAIWIQFNYAIYTPHCLSTNLTPELANDFCLGSWKIYISGYKGIQDLPARIKDRHFAFIKCAPLVTLLMSVLFIMARKYWLIAEEGRISAYVTEYKDKMLPTMEQETAEKKNIQNVREDRVAYLTRIITEYNGDQWYYHRYLLAQLMNGLIICGQLFLLHYVFGKFHSFIITTRFTFYFKATCKAKG